MVSNGFDVIGIDVSDHVNMIHGSSFKAFKCDITKAESLSDEIKEADILIHCAALVHNKSSDLTRHNYFRVNYEGTNNILNLLDLKRLKQIIFLSTVSVYGDQPNGVLIDEKSPTAPVDYYGESKLVAEDAIKQFSGSHKVPYTIFRLAPVYGDFFLLNINKRIYLPGKLAFYKIGSGEQRMSLASVNNVVDVIVESINNDNYLNQTFIIKDIEDYSVNEIINYFKGVKHYKPIIPIPLFLSTGILTLFKIIMPSKCMFYKYQLKKVMQDSVYSVEKLRSTGVNLRWNLYNTFITTHNL